MSDEIKAAIEESPEEQKTSIKKLVNDEYTEDEFQAMLKLKSAMVRKNKAKVILKQYFWKRLGLGKKKD